jgi:ABC-type amino acid transport substrate-binding protein
MEWRSTITHKGFVLDALIFSLALMCCLPAGMKGKSFLHSHIIDLEEMKHQRIVRVLVPCSKTIYFIDRGRQYGTAVEFGTALESVLNGRKKEIDRIHVTFIPTSRDRLLPALNEGLGDIVMANLTVTPSRQNEKADSQKEPRRWTGVEEVGAFGERSQRDSRGDTEDERNAPGQRHKE